MYENKRGFSLSFRDSENLAAHRTGLLSPIKQFDNGACAFGQTYTHALCLRRPRCGDTWLMDEVSPKINGEMHYLWRGVDQNGNVLDILTQNRQNKQAVKRFFWKLQYIPYVIIVDTLKSYGAAKREILSDVEHR